MLLKFSQIANIPVSNWSDHPYNLIFSQSYVRNWWVNISICKIRDDRIVKWA